MPKATERVSTPWHLMPVDIPARARRSGISHLHGVVQGPIRHRRIVTLYIFGDESRMIITPADGGGPTAEHMGAECLRPAAGFAAGGTIPFTLGAVLVNC